MPSSYWPRSMSCARLSISTTSLMRKSSRDMVGEHVLYYWITKKPLSVQPTGQIFMEMTRYNRLSRADQFQGLPAPSLEKPVPEDCRFIS
jgi:hypothetical protein